jgi:hypothetical protein
VLVHTYRKPEPAEDRVLPRFEDFRFHEARDVVAWAERDPTIGWKTWPEVWHLDEEGELQCCYSASSLDSIRAWADDPSDLRRSRRAGLADGGCTDQWLIIESRQQWRAGGPGPVVDERDAAAFFAVRTHLEAMGVRLLDVVIFDDAGHWWSLHELTSGSTAWLRS